MQEYIDKIGYGNKDISGGLTTFWLALLCRFPRWSRSTCSTSYIQGNCRFSAANTAILQKNITLSEDGGTKLMGKTGSALRNESGFQGGSSAVSKD